MDKDDPFDSPIATLKERFTRCVKGPKLLRTLVATACTAIVIQQVSASVHKLMYKPITTYTHFDFNKTLLYPSLTFCREPPYKYDKLERHGLYVHPRYTSTWRNFNFSRVTLDHLWDEITYSVPEYFVQFGLDGWMENVEVTARDGFVLGRCYTLSPKVLGYEASKAAGYSVTLQHSADDIANSISLHPPGYHVYVHYTKEPFTEVEVYNGGLIDYLYVNTGETLDVKLTVDEYVKISRDDDPCMNGHNYSANTECPSWLSRPSSSKRHLFQCTTEYVWDLVLQEAGCSGPWMVSNRSRCDSFREMSSLITAYMNTYQDHKCAVCPRFCHSYLYNAFVTSRHLGMEWDTISRQWGLKSDAAALQTQIYVHFNSMMVSVYEERHNYDWNIFVSDLGGSVGFLLGMSVISLTAIVGEMWFSLIRPLIGSKIKKDSISITTTSTADIRTVSKAKELVDDRKHCMNNNILSEYNIM